MSQFSDLCEGDKIALLKSGCPKIINLLSVLNFNFEGKFWTVPFECNSDLIMLDLLTTILLFNPNHPSLVHKD
ncbi:unnamed protein product, partial [Oppiella nova]